MVYAALLTAVAITAGALLAAPWTFEDDPALVSSIAELDGQWVDRPAPELELRDLQGRPHRLADYRGKVVFLNFWASYCAPCREEMPSMERLVRDYDEQGLVMVAVSYDRKPAEIRRFLDTFLPGQRTAMTVLSDPAGESGHAFGTELIPETYIIDRRGRIVARFVNAYDWTRPEVRELIERLLRET
jgi:thiol-disulfide isomerase/thioredoxin